MAESLRTRHRDPRQQAIARRHRRRRRRRRRIQSLSVLPTLCTLGNLVCGFAAIHYALKPMDFRGPFGWSSLTLAGILIFAGMFLDAVDGSIARLTRSVSDLGTQLDALCDLLTFGVAPAFMMLRLVSYYVGDQNEMILEPATGDAVAKTLWGVAAVYVCCSAMRLARFNVETPTAVVENHMIFRGLPTPGAAGAIASLIILHQHRLAIHGLSPEEASVQFARFSAFGLPLITLLCALAMVSSLPYVHFTNRYIRGGKSFHYVAGIVVLLGLAVWWTQELLALVFTTYALSAPVRMLTWRVRRWLRR